MEKEKNVKDKVYLKTWFMWLMLFFITPVGLYLMWKYHKEISKNIKIILTIIFFIFFIVVLSSLGTDEYANYDSGEKQKPDQKEELVTVVDFSSMSLSDIEAWCSENKITCTNSKAYSDNVEKDGFISQSIKSNEQINKNTKITIYYSLGKKPSTEYLNALKKAESYSRTLHMSKKGIYNQLTSEYGEQFSTDAAQYAIDNIKADWNANALSKAKSYQQTMNMSKSAIYDQLISEYGEKFTAEEAQYAIDHLDD